MRDVDPPLTVEETLAGMRRNLQMLYQCNRALIRATEEYELLQSVCQILVDVGGLRMVWIGYRQFDQENTIRPVAIGGYDEEMWKPSKAHGRIAKEATVLLGLPFELASRAGPGIFEGMPISRSGKVKL